MIRWTFVDGVYTQLLNGIKKLFTELNAENKIL